MRLIPAVASSSRQRTGELGPRRRQNYRHSEVLALTFGPHFRSMVSSATPPIGPNLGAAVPGFGTDGIRGRAGTVLTPALCLQVGYWMGQVLQQEGPVLIGMDSRSSGSMLVAALTAGLTAAGRDVWTLGLCPTLPYLC